jgi:hypothetical protein
MSKLFKKYVITKSDGSPVDPAAQYFVLRIDTDPAARHAVLMYASHIGANDPQFADDLRQWVLSQPALHPTPDQADATRCIHGHEVAKDGHCYQCWPE